MLPPGLTVNGPERNDLYMSTRTPSGR